MCHRCYNGEHHDHEGTVARGVIGGAATGAIVGGMVGGGRGVARGAVAGAVTGGLIGAAVERNRGAMEAYEPEGEAIDENPASFAASEKVVGEEPEDNSEDNDVNGDEGEGADIEGDAA